jgi:enoyl-CoA hydratase/carnithine racemase
MTDQAAAPNILVQDDGAIRTIRMNRPAKKNALTQPMYAQMTRALDEAGADSAIRCIILAGAPNMFCAGSDIGDFQKRAEGGLEPVTVDFLRALVRNEKPLVAAVGGAAVGIGTTMLLHCDHVVAASGATFATPFLKLGLIPEAASSLLAPLRLGHARAFSLLVMGRPLSAQDAREAGIVNTVVDAAVVEETALKAAQEIAALPPNAVMLARRLMRSSSDESVAERIEVEVGHFQQLLKSDAARAAFAAFFARKK